MGEACLQVFPSPPASQRPTLDKRAEPSGPKQRSGATNAAADNPWAVAYSASHLRTLTLLPAAIWLPVHRASHILSLPTWAGAPTAAGTGDHSPAAVPSPTATSSSTATTTPTATEAALRPDRGVASRRNDALQESSSSRQVWPPGLPAPATAAATAAATTTTAA